MTRILFLCHGNICRSPMAEFIFKELAKQRGLQDNYHVESAAVSTEELGNPLYPPARRCLTAHGIPFDLSRTAWQVRPQDYDRYDRIIYMDRSNMLWLSRIMPDDPQNKIRLMMSYAGQASDVADPWYTGDFEATYRDIVKACTAMLDADGNVVLNEHNKAEHEPSHTAEHLLNQTMVRMFGCERSRNAHIERKKSKINFNLAECPSEAQIKSIEDKMNELVRADLPVTYEFVTRDTIPAGVKLDKLPEDASETLRLVRIGGYDICPCIGSHVQSTAQIGEFRITSTSFSEGSFRIVFRVFPPGE